MYNKSTSVYRRFRRLTLHSGYLAESAGQPHIKVPGGISQPAS